MAHYVINGGKRLEGTVTIGGAKNAAVAIIPAVILAGEPCHIENLPNIEDVHVLEKILSMAGAKIQHLPDGSVVIDPTSINTQSLTFDIMQTLRASYYMLGALLGRYGHAEIALPGGCPIGARPIDQHIKGMRALGAEIDIDKKGIIHAEGKLVGAEIYMDIVSVGATINLMLAASRAVGTTVINNAAKEPHVVDVANFLNMMGASVKGAGTDVIRIKGTDELHGCTYAIIPDQIEAGTYMIAAAATRGNVILQNIIPTHLEAISAKLMESGVHVTEGDNGREYYLNISADSRPRAVDIKTLPYPGFPTDLQQPMMSFLSVSGGSSLITENIFEDRFNHVTELNRMGANIRMINRHTAHIEGVDALHGMDVYATDLRASAALVVAALMAEGESRVFNLHYIDRGYEHLEHKFRALGADITRVED